MRQGGEEAVGEFCPCATWLQNLLAASPSGERKWRPRWLPWLRESTRPHLGGYSGTSTRLSSVFCCRPSLIVVRSIEEESLIVVRSIEEGFSLVSRRVGLSSPGGWVIKRSSKKNPSHSFFSPLGRHFCVAVSIVCQGRFRTSIALVPSAKEYMHLDRSGAAPARATKSPYKPGNLGYSTPQRSN